MKTVADLLKLKPESHRQVHTVTPHQTVLEALQLMKIKNIGALLVVESDHEKVDHVVGIVSERDYARKMVLEGRSSAGTPVKTIMTPNVITVEPKLGVSECMTLMTEKKLRHLPVVDNGKLIGLLSIGDLVKEAIAEQASLIEQLQSYIRGEV